MKISIIGAGNMGGAIAKGLAQSVLINTTDITVTAATQKTLDAIKSFNKDINTSKNNSEAIKNANIIIIAVKPWLIDKIAKEIAPYINNKQIIVSVVAGVPFEYLDKLFRCTKGTLAMFRVIPNTAISIKESMTAIASYNASTEQEELILSIFNELGKSILIEERLIGAATALGSCGTAFALRYIRAAIEGGIEMGLYAHQAKEIVSQTVKGAAELLIHNQSHPEEEIDKVTTPGGITIKGLNEMEHAGFTSAIICGLKASR